jgi:hypothetical protein
MVWLSHRDGQSVEVVVAEARDLPLAAGADPQVVALHLAIQRHHLEVIILLRPQAALSA